MTAAGTNPGRSYQTDPSNNPAGRLRELLIRAKNVAPAGNGAGIVWARVFDMDIPPKTHNVPDELQQDVIERMIQVRKLIDETEVALKTVGASEKYFKPFPQLRDLIYVSLLGLSGDISGRLLQIDSEVLAILDFAAEKLSNERPETIIDKDELHTIDELVGDLFETTRTSKEIDADLREFILTQLEIIRRGIHEHWIRGAVRVREALAQVAANFMFKPEFRAVASGPLTKLKAIVVRLATATAGTAGKAVVESTVKGLLTGGS